MGGIIKKRVCLAGRGAVYSVCMSDEQEDMNAFNSWDCFGATLMLGMVPGIIHFATTEPYDVAGAAVYCGIGVLVALVVLAVALITRWRFLGTLVNTAGTILTAVFIIYITLFWTESCTEYSQKQKEVPAQQQLRG